MEYDAFCRIRVKDINQLNFAKLMIEADESAPLFEHEVEPELRQMFSALEDVSVATSISVDEISLSMTVHWFTAYSDEIEETIKGMTAAGVVSFCILVLSDEGGVDGFVYAGETLKRLTEWDGEPLMDLSRNGDMSQLLVRIEKQECLID